MLSPMEKQDCNFPGTDYGDHGVLLGQGITEPSSAEHPCPPLSCCCGMEAGTWEKQRSKSIPVLEEVLLLIRPETRLCLTAALADVTQHRPGAREHGPRQASPH